MDYQLTHKDREYIRKSLLNVTLDPSEKDQSLIRNTSLYLRNNPPVCSAERSYHQFAVDLINFLRQKPDDSRSETVRRALKFLQPFGEHSHVHVIPAVKAFVAGFALHEISDHGQLLLADETQGLSLEEKQDAEAMLLDLAGSSGGDDAELLEQTHCFVASLGDGESTSIVIRFLRNIRKLTEVLSGDGEWSTEQKTWARGALHYVHLNEDAIPDDIGIVGLLDDMYVVATAVSFIGTVAQSIEEVVSDLYATWPFLRDLVLTCGENEYTYSEFALINTALTCPALTANGHLERSALILPSSGITPFMVAFGAALGAAYDAAESPGDVFSFTPGQKVRVDNDAVAIFDGMMEIQGNQFLRLKRYSTSKGQRNETASFIPADQAGRLCPAPDDATPRGNIPTQIDDAKITLAGTEALFHLPLPQQFNVVSGRVWLVSQISTVRALVSGIQLYGHPLSGVIPMGHIKKDGSLERWDSRFGTTDCILTTVPDLDLAAEILEEKKLTAGDLVVIDLGGTNRNKFAALSQIQSLDARVLCIAEEKDTDTISNLEKSSYEFWEWSFEEVKELVNNSEPDTDGEHPFRESDGSVMRSLVLRPDICVLNSTDAQKAKTDLDHLDTYVRRAGEDVPEELQDLRDELFSIALELIRLPVPLSSLPDGAGKMTGSLVLLSEKIQRSLYLDEKEKSLTLASIESLQCFALNIEESNLKADAIAKAAESTAGVRVLMPPRFPAGVPLLQNETENYELFLPWKSIREVECETLIIPYWPGRRRAWDILSNPPSREICFILYSFEDTWRSAFYRSRDRSRTQRAERSRRSKIFNRNYRWRAPPVSTALPVSQEGTGDDTLIEEQDFRFRQQAVHAARREGDLSDTVARMIVFHGGTYAFFTPEHEALSATHLMSGSIDNTGDEEKLRAVKVNDLAEGDVLVFLRGTDRDAIRELADANLPSGMRETAKLWQKSLKAYVSDKGIGLVELKKRLEKAGCKRHVVTLKQWLESELLIGPRGYASGDLDAIAQLTGDEEFQARMGECANAISKVWGEHLRASGMIAERVLSSIEDRITVGLDLAVPLDIGDGLILAQVEYIENEDVTVPFSAVNQLKEYV
ncbi:MAG: DrmE family protein [Candidatus Sedimenticola sp. 6PFRAG7]